ncbi:pyrimidine pathway regulatory protein 1 [Diplogelasinospora grovesii]|uniref:Pyrimidine pathway regulatory protein 1 n=1 Tax=Diplogelasinospora grovesii TaxID=303347 RepID=A0AAN6S170_9PEZI|nr:pyrimidine pathway regulatory protein 1 [Diplogelasinospora grovesii]
MPAVRRIDSKLGTTMSAAPRQQPGSACEECRKRKLRCDRAKPQCGTCADAGVPCEVSTQRLTRGPKRGDLKALRSRIVALERRLSIDHTTVPECLLMGGDGEMPTLDDMPAHNSGSDGELTQLSSPREKRMSWDGGLPPLTPAPTLSGTPYFKFPPSPPSPPRRTVIHGLMRADLDQLYFDRVHPNVPIFNQSRYFVRSQQLAEVGGPNHQLCLQYAMWTLAMAMSSQFESFRDALYNETRQMLESLDSDNDMGVTHIEEAQAWLLITYYEFARSNYRRGWRSAGRTFRLIQQLRLHEIDSPESRTEGEDPVVMEERRRTFWVAYSLDRLISMKNRSPLTLIEEVIRTRLPSPELAFQGGHPIEECFLSEAIASSDHSLLSPLAECAILVTICGRALSHCHVLMVERTYGSASLDFWPRHEWLDGVLTKRLETLSASYPVMPAVADPMLLFAFMMAQTTTIYLCRIMEALDMANQRNTAVVKYQQRAVRAAREIASLTKAHERMGYIKAHIFLPLAVSLGASRFMSEHTRSINEFEVVIPDNFNTIQSEHDHGFDAELFSCMDALQKMQTFNNLANEHLRMLETQDFSTCYR